MNRFKKFKRVFRIVDFIIYSVSLSDFRNGWVGGVSKGSSTDRLCGTSSLEYQIDVPVVLILYMSHSYKCTLFSRQKLGFRYL